MARARMNLRPHPHDTQAEQALIAAVLLDPVLIGDIDLAPSEFYHPAHKTIWRGMAEVRPLDAITLTHHLRTQGTLDTIDGQATILRIIDTPTTANPAHYAHIIRQNAARRNIVVKARNLARMAADYTCDKGQMEQAVKELLGEVARLGYGGTSDPRAEETAGGLDATYQEVAT